MKKLLIVLLLVSNVAKADPTAYVQYLGSMLIGGAITTGLKNMEVNRQNRALDNRQIEVLPSNSPPPLFKKCELRSVQIDGRVVTNQYCY